MKISVALFQGFFKYIYTNYILFCIYRNPEVVFTIENPLL